MERKTAEMKPIMWWLGVAVCAALVVAAGPAASAEYLADRHAARDIDCEDCHQESPPSKPVKSAQCESCHGNNDAVAKLTKASRHNPHFTHLGDVACLECHQAHQPSRLVCDDCHKFAMKVP
jgi:fumarate reductase flavoprotein subunit